MENPETYAKYTSGLEKDVETFLELMTPSLKFEKNENILDIGCGPGNITDRLLSHYTPQDAKIVGADISEKMIEYSQTHFGSDKISFRLLDIGSSNIWMNWEMNSFDKIYSFHCLHWVKQLEQAVENIGMLLKENGDLLTLTISKTPYFKLFNALYNDPKYAVRKQMMKTFEAMFSDFDEEQYIRSLEASGFQIVSTSTKEVRQYFPSQDVFADFVDSINPFMSKIVGEEASEVREDTIRKALSGGLFQHTEDGGITYSYTIQCLHARKLKTPS